MVNYKRVVCDVAVLLLIAASAASAPTPDEKHYDQRQNGTENYRLNIDGVVVAVVPAESFIAAASDFSDLFDVSDLESLFKPTLTSFGSENSTNKPDKTKPEPAKPEETSISDVSSDMKPQKKDASARKQEKVKRLKQRIATMLIPLLRKTRNHH